MALTSADFLSPKGLVERIFFPSDKLPELKVRLQGYLTEGAGVLGGAGGDVALSNYVYWRVFDAVHTRLSIRPAKLAKKEGSAEFLLSQIDSMKEKALEYKAKWEAALAVPVVPQHTAPTMTLPVSFGP